MKQTAYKIKLCVSAFLLFLTLTVSLVTTGVSFDNTRIFFAGDSAATFCLQTVSGPDLYQESLFSRLKVSPLPGFIIEPQQDILSRTPCSLSNPDGSGYGGLKILDWNTACTDASGNGMCSWSCYDCPDPECEINRNSLPLGGEADWCCCGSRKSCVDQSDAQYIILSLLGNDLLQLFKFYGNDVDLVVEEAKTLTNFITSQGRTVIWLSFYPLGYGSLGNGESACSDPLSCLFAANSNAEYFYGQFIPWINNQSDVYLIDFFDYIKETYAPNPATFINTYGYDGVHLTPAGHQIYYDYVYSRLTALLTQINDQDRDGVPDISDNCPNYYNPNHEDTYPPQSNGCGDACECEGNFDGDADQDGTDAFTFKQDFGRSVLLRPCTIEDLCNGDFTCDGDVDGTDAFQFKSDFGRSSILNPCPDCVTVPWCVYP